MLLKILHTHELSNNLSTDCLPVDDCVSPHALDTTIVLKYSVAAPGLLDAKYNQSSFLQSLQPLQTAPTVKLPAAPRTCHRSIFVVSYNARRSLRAWFPTQRLHNHTWLPCRSLSKNKQNPTPPPPKSFMYKKVVEAQLQRIKPHTDTPPFQYAFWRKSLRRHDCNVFVL